MAHGTTAQQARDEAAGMPSIRVRDLPTRLFHRALVVCVAGSMISAKIGVNAMVRHFRFGYAIFGLLVSRVVWGVVGGRWSRFSSFVAPPLLALLLIGLAGALVYGVLQFGRAGTGG